MKRQIFSWAALLLIPLTAMSAGLQPGEYHDQVHVVISGAPTAIPPHNAERKVCITAADVAENGRHFAEMQKKAKRACDLSKTSFTDGKASWHMSCKGGVTGDSKAEWSTDQYIVTTHMTQSAGGMQIVSDSTVTGKRIGDCEK